MAGADMGPVLGKPVEVIFADSQLKADVASSLARKWWDVDGVDAICDLSGSAVALAVMAISADKKKIALASSPGSSDFTGKLCSPYTTQWTYDTYGNGTTLGRQILQEGGNTKVLHRGRLRLRRIARGRYHCGNRARRRQSARRGSPSAEHGGLLVVSAFGVRRSWRWQVVQ